MNYTRTCLSQNWQEKQKFIILVTGLHWAKRTVYVLAEILKGQVLNNHQRCRL